MVTSLFPVEDDQESIRKERQKLIEDQKRFSRFVVSMKEREKILEQFMTIPAYYEKIGDSSLQQHVLSGERKWEKRLANLKKDMADMDKKISARQEEYAFLQQCITSQTHQLLDLSKREQEIRRHEEVVKDSQKKLTEREEKISSREEAIRKFTKEYGLTKDSKELPEIITVNISGRKFKGAKTRFLNDCGEYFKTVLSATGWRNHKIYIDRDPDAFALYMKCVRTNEEAVKGLSRDEAIVVQNEASFFMNDKLRAAVAHHIAHLHSRHRPTGFTSRNFI